MDILTLIIILVAVGALLYLVPMEPRIRTLIVVVVVIVVLILLLRGTGAVNL